MEKKDLQIVYQHSVWRKFCNNKLALAGFIFICTITFIALLGYLIIPDKTPFSNNQCLEIAAQKPGYSALFFKKPTNGNISNVTIFHTLVYGKKSTYELVPIDTFYVEKGFLVVHKLNDPQEKIFYMKIPITQYQNNSVYNEGEFIKTYITKHTFLLGTDRFGRDVLSRLVIGARISLAVGLIAVFISLIIGVSLGAIAGYYRGWTDKIIMWFVNVTWSVPTLLMVIALTMVLGKGFWQMFVAVGLTMWVEVARIVRGQVLGIREKEYIEACRAMGFNSARIIIKHILPNILGPIIIISAANFASAILIESGLSFLGIGIQPPIPSWGNMIKDHYGYIILDKAYLAIFPGLAIMLLTLAFSFVGNGLRDAFDSKSINLQ